MKHFLLLFVICLVSCKSRDKLIADLRSGDKLRVIEACSQIKGPEDSMYVAVLLEQAEDPRITHDLRYQGMSVYQHKMYALSRISGIKPGQRISYKVDPAIIQLYRDWAREKGLVN